MMRTSQALPAAGPPASSRSRHNSSIPLTTDSGVDRHQEQQQKQQQQQQQQPVVSLINNAGANIGAIRHRSSLPAGASVRSLPPTSSLVIAADAGSGEFTIDLGGLTQTPRGRVSSVPQSVVSVYRMIQRALALLTCFIGVSDLALAVADIVIGYSIVTEDKHWICSGTNAGRAILASGVTGLVFCLALLFTQYLATGNTVVHSSITALLMVASLAHTCSALPRLQFSYEEAATCTARSRAYMLLTSIGRLTTLAVTCSYYGLLNYYVCRFGEDNTTTSHGSSR